MCPFLFHAIGHFFTSHKTKWRKNYFSDHCIQVCLTDWLCVRQMFCQEAEALRRVLVVWWEGARRGTRRHSHTCSGSADLLISESATDLRNIFMTATTRISTPIYLSWSTLDQCHWWWQKEKRRQMYLQTLRWKESFWEEGEAEKQILVFNLSSISAADATWENRRQW